MAPGALDGVRVADIASFLAGPTVSMFLGDFGAEVIKVERPDGGDESRMWGHRKDDVGLYYKVINRNKQSVTADLRTDFGAEVVRRLARVSDVLIENFRPGTLERWGLGYDVLSAENPDLIVLRVSGFGQTGPYRQRPGFGTLAEAFSGFAYTNGFPDRPPLLPGFGLADSTTGLMGAFLVLAALRAREQGRCRGQVIDLAIYETLYTLLGPQVVDFDQLGIVQERSGSRLPFTAPRNIFRTADDKWIAIGGSSQSVFERICRALERSDLIDDPRFSDNQARLEHVVALDELLAAAVSKLALEQLLARFEQEEAAVSPVNNVAQTFEDPQFVARRNLVEVDDDELGPIRMQSPLGNLSATPGIVRSSGPKLGEHTLEVLVSLLGFSPEQLRENGYEIDA
jgi:crotonobetainyl-CoA:carnitine CoA-transferase CaiB-like acyl-CoA transferase